MSTRLIILLLFLHSCVSKSRSKEEQDEAKKRPDDGYVEPDGFYLGAVFEEAELTVGDKRSKFKIPDLTEQTCIHSNTEEVDGKEVTVDPFLLFYFYDASHRHEFIIKYSSKLMPKPSEVKVFKKGAEVSFVRSPGNGNVSEFFTGIHTIIDDEHYCDLRFKTVRRELLPKISNEDLISLYLTEASVSCRLGNGQGDSTIDFNGNFSCMVISSLP